MALVECNECKHKVSDSAKICPNCGAKDPAYRVGCLNIIVLAIFIMIIWEFIN